MPGNALYQQCGIIEPPDCLMPDLKGDLSGKLPVSAIAGFAAVLGFCICSFIAIALYPGPFNPLFAWMSNLGNVDLNPEGAIFFNAANVFTGILLISFFLGLYIWYDPLRWRTVLLILGQAAGILGSVALIFVGIYPETRITGHLIAADLFFSSLVVTLLILNLALFTHPRFMRWVGWFGFLVVAVNIIFAFSLIAYKEHLDNFNPAIPVPGLEWASVFMALVWVGALSYNMAKPVPCRGWSPTC